MSDMAIAATETSRTQIARSLSYALMAVVCLHGLLLLLAGPASIPMSRYLSAAVPILAAIACIWRTGRLAARERPIWLWSAAGLLLWALAHIVETVHGHSAAASNLSVDVSDFIYIAAIFPLLVAL